MEKFIYQLRLYIKNGYIHLILEGRKWAKEKKERVAAEKFGGVVSFSEIIPR